MDNLEDFDEEAEEHLESIEWLLDIVDISIDVVFYSGAIFSFLLTLCLLYSFMIKNSLLSTAYFYILVIGYVVDLLSTVIYVLSTYLLSDVLIIIKLNNLIQWYAKLFVGFWNSILVLNRFTALLFWNKQEKIWSEKSMGFIIFLMLVYPFIINGYQIFGNVHCALNSYNKECTSFLVASRNFMAIANGANALIALILGFVTAFSGRLRLSLMSTQTNMKLEKRLLTQSLISTLLFGSYCALTAAYSILYPKRNNLKYSIAFDFARDFSNLFYMIFHYSSAVLLIIVSRPTREAFIHFYFMHKLFPCLFKSKSTQNSITRMDRRVATTIQTF